MTLEQLHAHLTRYARRDGMGWHDAEDIAQDVIARHLDGKLAANGEPGQVLATAMVIARRAGTWAVLGSQANRDRSRAMRAKDGRYKVPVRGASATYPDPVSMAEQAERHRIPLARVHEAYGVGPYAMTEPNTTPSVYGSGEGWTMPEPIPADRYPTDPNPASRLHARMECAAAAERVGLIVTKRQ